MAYDDDSDTPRRRVSDRMGERDPYEAVLELVRVTRDEQREGFRKLEQSLDRRELEHDQCRESVQVRLGALERWQSGIVAIAGTIAGAISLGMTLLVHWITGRH